jgi:O-antigen/teichoic acid export membrane protein
MYRFYNLITKSSFLKNSSILFGGTCLSILIQVLATPILTRLYSPKEFGAFALFFSIVTFLSIIITAKYELTVLLPKDNVDGAALVLISIIISFIFSSIILCGIFIFVEIFKFNIWLYLVPLTCLFIGFFQSGCYWLIRQKKFVSLAKIKIMHVFITVISSVLLSFILTDYWGLMIGYAAGYVITGSVVLVIIFQEIKKHWADIDGMSKLLKCMRRYRDFPLYSNITGLIEIFSAQLPTFLLTSFFGVSTVGFYSMAQRVTNVPVRAIAAAIGDVFRQKASSEYTNQEGCKGLFLKVLVLLTTLAIISFSIFFVIAPELFELVFGKEWRISGEYARIVTGMLSLQFIVGPLSNMFMIAEKQKISLIIQIYLLIGSSIALWFGYYYFHSVKMCLVLYTIVYCVKYLFELIMSYKFSLGAGHIKPLIIKKN